MHASIHTYVDMYVTHNACAYVHTCMHSIAYRIIVVRYLVRILFAYFQL